MGKSAAGNQPLAVGREVLNHPPSAFPDEGKMPIAKR